MNSLGDKIKKNIKYMQLHVLTSSLHYHMPSSTIGSKFMTPCRGPTNHNKTINNKNCIHIANREPLFLLDHLISNIDYSNLLYTIQYEE